MRGQQLNAPIIAMAPTQTGHGYWLLAKDGGVFTFGDAKFYGSTGSMKLNAPIIGMGAAAGGDGYWVVLADGRVVAFGDAQHYGDAPRGARLVAFAVAP